MVQGSIPAWKEIFLFFLMSRLALQPIQLHVHCLPGMRKADHSPSSGAEVKND
jgi:hypothetical protein